MADVKTLRGTEKSDSLSNNEDDIFIEALGGNDTVNNGYNESGGYHATTDNVTVYGGDGNDSLFSAMSNRSLIDGGKGDDIIDCDRWNYEITIKGGAGDDSIYSFVNNKAQIYGEDGNDTICNEGSDSVTMDSGLGNDSIKNDGKYVLFRYVNGDGDDTIIGLNATSTLNISGGNYSTTESDNAIIVKVGDGTITLPKYAVGTELNIIGKEITDTTPADTTPADTTPADTTPADTTPADTTPVELSKGNDDNESYWTLGDLKDLLNAFKQLSPINTAGDVADAGASIISIFESVIDIAENKKAGADLTGELMNTVGEVTNIIGVVKGLKGKNNLFYSLAASGLGCLGSFISTFAINSSFGELTDDDKAKLEDLAESTANLMNDSVETTFKVMGKFSSLSQAETNALAKQARLKANVAISVLMAGYSGYMQYQESVAEYSAEGLPLSTVAGETFIDVIAAGLHGGIHQYTYGLDDLAFKGLRWVGAKLLGNEPVDTDKDYMEWIAEGIKYAMFGSTSADDILETKANGKPLYGQDGDDYIRNAFSNVSIYGGKGNDTIFSYEGTRRNYFDGGTGRDYIIAHDTKSELHGSDENDKLISLGDNNSLIGGAGIDFIMLNEVTGNTVEGGKDNDLIALESSKSTWIYYSQGDGTDIIFGFDSDDTIHISGNADYKKSEVSTDIEITVGDGKIILKDTAGKKVNIETRNTDDSPIENIDPFKPNPIMDVTPSRNSSANLGGSSSSTTKGGNSSTSTTSTETIQDILNSMMGTGSTSTTGTSSTSTTRSGSSTTTTSVGSIRSVLTSTTRDGSSSTSTKTTDTSTTTDNNQNVYTGGDQVISNYAGQPITLGAYTGATFDETGNFFVGSPTGTLAIQNATDKIVDLRDASDNDFIKAYQPSTAGVIDGRGLAGYEIINGSSTGSNVIFAGDGGSQLWGGSGFDADALVGGNGSDIFVGGRLQGADNIFNASSADVVNLNDATLSDIVATVGNNSGIAIGFNTGNVVNIQSTDALSAAVNLADGSSWRYNHVTKGWQSA